MASWWLDYAPDGRFTKDKALSGAYRAQTSPASFLLDPTGAPHQKGLYLGQAPRPGCCGEGAQNMNRVTFRDGAWFCVLKAGESWRMGRGISRAHFLLIYVLF